MLGKGEKRLVAAYSAAHFAVDLCCAMLVLPAARAASDKAMALLIYNFCAFAMQLPIGVLADRYGGGRYFSAIGCLMVALGGLLPSPMLTAVVCGLGNAAFHIGGGADVMAVTEGAKYLGIYVSPGAMGIFLGALASRAGRSLAAFAACLMLACAAAIMALCREGAGPGSPELPRGREQWLRLMSLLAVVTLRSYGGVIMSFPWRAGAWAWIAALCVVGGKCIGGFASDRFGEVRSATVTLSAAAIALIFSAFPLPGALGIEIVPQAIENAKENAVRNGIGNVNFRCGAAEALLPKLVAEGLRPDVIVIDPPRKGVEPAVIDAIAQAAPKRVVYVSCNVATQARDAALFVEKGYRVQKVQSVDMFCWTSGVETVMSLVQQKPDDIVKVGIDADELAVTKAESKATYGEIQARVKEQTGLNVTPLYIAQVKRKHGIIERECYNKAKSESARC